MSSMLRRDHVLCRQACGYVQPALYEAFGLTVVEAMSRGLHSIFEFFRAGKF